MDRRDFVKLIAAAAMAILGPLVRWAQQHREIEVYDDLGFDPRHGSRGRAIYNAREGRWVIVMVEC